MSNVTLHPISPIYVFDLLKRFIDGEVQDIAFSKTFRHKFIFSFINTLSKANPGSNMTSGLSVYFKASPDVRQHFRGGGSSADGGVLLSVSTQSVAKKGA